MRIKKTQSLKQLFLKFLMSFFVFLAAAIYITYPLIFNLSSSSTGYGDEFVIAWIQNWVINSLLSGNILNLFEANLYYPYHNTLAFSETFITSSILSILVKLFTNEPIATVNFTLIMSLTILGFSIFSLAYYLTKSLLPSMLSGFMVIFSSAVLSHYVHLHILGIGLVSFAILFYLLFLESGKSKFLILFLVSFLLQIYNSILPAYFIVFSVVIINVVYWFYKRNNIIKAITGRQLILILITGLLIIPLAVPYFQVSNEFKYVRDIRDAIHFALQPEDLLYPSIFTRLDDSLRSLPINLQSQNNEFKPGYLGVVFTILVIISIIYFIKKKKRDPSIVSFFIIGITGLLVSLGPVLHLGRQTIHEPFPIPLPYALFYYVLPGFQGFRNSARWEMLFIVAFAVVVTLVLHYVLSKRSKKLQYIIYGLLFIGIVSEYSFPMQLFNVPTREQFPKVYSWISETPKDSVIIEMPVHNWNSPFVQEELWREYYGTIHFRRTVNGYTGFSPPPWQELVQFLNNEFPNNKSIDRLRSIKVNYIIVHVKQVDELYKAKKTKVNGKQTLNILRANRSIKQIKQFDNIYVFELPR